jgi:hypothetical protein
LRLDSGELIDGVQYFVCVHTWVDVWPYAGDAPAFVYEKGNSRSHAQPVRHSVRFLNAPGVVGDERERQLVFLEKLRVTGFVVTRDAEDLNPALAETRPSVPERTGFARAAGRGVFGIEIHDREPTAVLRQPALLACYVMSTDIRGDRTNR